MPTSTAPGEKAAAPGEAVTKAPDGTQLTPQVQDERHVSFEEKEGDAARDEKRPKKTFQDLTAREKWLWAFDKVMNQIAVSNHFYFHFTFH